MRYACFRRRVCAVAFALPSLAGCLGVPLPPEGRTGGVPLQSRSVAGEDLGRLREQVAGLMREPVCAETADCKTLPFGAKACGGPKTYLVYSLKTTDVPLLESTVEKYNRQEAAQNRETGAVSDCMFVSEPRVSCVKSRCVRNE